MEIDKMTQAYCNKCGYEWRIRTPFGLTKSPRQCPECRSYDIDYYIKGKSIDMEQLEAKLERLRNREQYLWEESEILRKTPEPTTYEEKREPVNPHTGQTGVVVKTVIDEEATELARLKRKIQIDRLERQWWALNRKIQKMEDEQKG
jgi:hypothetical protein